MNIPLIEMPKAAAKAAFREYRDAVKAKHNADDVALMRGYRELVRGNRVLDITTVMNFSGIDEQGRPRLAICRADTEHCWFVGFHQSRQAVFSRFEPRWNFRTTNLNTVQMPSRTFGNALTRNTLRAIVPTVPPRFRPASALKNYHILWEAEWEVVPRDPMLLRHIGGSLYAVLAHWDLTDLEMAVLRRRL